MQQQAGRGLGWFSIGLGLAEVLAPDQVGRLAGIGDRRALLQALGVRELITGVGLLTQRSVSPWLWGRVSGDMMDLALLLAALGLPKARRHRVAGAAGVIVAITALDIVRALQPSGRE